MGRSRILAIDDICLRDPFVRHCPTQIRMLVAAARQTPGPERAAGHSDFVILSSFLRASSFVLRHSSTRDMRTQDRARHGDNDCSTQRERIWTSSRQVVSRSARRFRALPFLLAMFHRQFPPAEPSLLNRSHPSSWLETNRDHHLRPLAEDNL